MVWGTGKRNIVVKTEFVILSSSQMLPEFRFCFKKKRHGRVKCKGNLDVGNKEIKVQVILDL